MTHDRWFLDEVCTATWEVHDRIVEPFEGGYAAYILQRVERDRMAATSEAKRQNLARKELAWLRRGAPARTSKPQVPHRRGQRADRRRAGDPRQGIAAVARRRPARQGRRRPARRVGRLRRQPRAHDVEWRIAPGERTGILGVNGAGKSTLLGLIAGTVRPRAGTVRRGKTVRIATLTQRIGELEDHLDEPVAGAARRPAHQLHARHRVKGPGADARPAAGAARLLDRELSTPVKDLSGGQQRRLQLLLILLDQPNVLILDEPTNDLDTDMLAAIEDLLDSWPGTLLVVSHDRYFLERVTDQQYAILAGKLRHLPGGVDEYLRLRAADGRDAAPLYGARRCAPAGAPALARR